INAPRSLPRRHLTLKPEIVSLVIFFLDARRGQKPMRPKPDRSSDRTGLILTRPRLLSHRASDYGSTHATSLVSLRLPPWRPTMLTTVDLVPRSRPSSVEES
ncbi:hypothetical protein Dimus_037716, partial [Dionaea muscipula]